MRWFYRLWPERREAGKRALVLSGGGVIGGMYEVGVLAALDEELQGCCVNNFDMFVGSSAGAVVAFLMANGVRAGDPRACGSKTSACSVGPGAGAFVPPPRPTGSGPPALSGIRGEGVAD